MDTPAASQQVSLEPYDSRRLASLCGRLDEHIKQIADRLDIQERTVKAHLSAIFEKLGARNRTQASVILRELEISDPVRVVEG